MVRILFLLVIFVLGIISTAQQRTPTPPEATATALVNHVQATQTAFAAPPPAPCMSLVGDSISYGIGVFEVPGHGFPVVRTEPLATYFRSAFDENEIALTVHDRSVIASFLGVPSRLDPIQVVYSDTTTYDDLLADRCEWTIILPWYNDLLILDREEPGSAYVDTLSVFIDALRTNNPAGHIIMLNYYYGDPAPFTLGADVALQPENIDLYNAALEEACALGGALEHVTCFDTQALFEPIDDNSHLIVQYGRNLFNELDVIGIEAGRRAMFDIYFRNNPNSIIRGDGIHLTQYGKEILVEALVDVIVR